MAERVGFIDSFDHAGPTYAPSKYVHAGGTVTEVTGPYHGVAARFGARGVQLGPARANANWDSGAWSASVRVDSSGWTGSGELALLAPCYWNYNDIDGVIDFPQHWLTVDSAGTLRVRSWASASGSTTSVLAASASGALPLGAWARLEYRTQIRGATTPTGTVGCRVNGAVVLDATGLVTGDIQRNVSQCDYFRFGHLDATAGSLGGVGGLGSGAEAVGVAVDDVAQRLDTTFGAALLAYRDDPALPHRVVCLRPTGPGQYAEFPRVGAAANWDACDEAPPDGGTSYVERVAVASEAELPVDLYATAAAPLFDEGAGAVLSVWGLASTDAGLASTTTLRFRDGDGSETAARVFLLSAGVPALAYRYARAGPSSAPDGLTNADLAGLEIGWGARFASQAALGQTYRGTQVVAELWYRPAEAPEPPPTGGQRWSIGWVP